MSIHFSLPSSTDQPINLLDGWRLRDTRGQSSRERNTYLNTLEKASVGQDIVPFADFLAGLVRKQLAGEPLPPVPKSTS
jgi:hypothetical protein